MYFSRIPKWLQWLYPNITWDLPNDENKVYLTFDDGPHPVITPKVLDLLKQHDAKATFFCLGKNVERYPDVYQRILDEGHSVGNHTFSHPDGWKTNDVEYLENIEKAKGFIGSDFFRPPYGKIKRSQAKKIIQNLKFNIYNFSLIAGDFDPTITTQQCYKNLQRVRSGDIIVLHDSEKAWKHLEYCLPEFLEEFKMFKFEKII